MKDFMIRFWFVMTIVLLIIIGVVIIGVGHPAAFDIINPEIAGWFNDGERPILYKIGTIWTLLTIVVFFGISVFVPFSKTTYTPKQVDRLRAQDKAIYLVDQRIYTMNDPKFHELYDLDRIRVVVFRNLFYGLVKITLTMSDELTVPAPTPQIKVTEIPEDNHLAPYK